MTSASMRDLQNIVHKAEQCNFHTDFGYAHLSTLIKSCNFPWLLSNIVDSNTGKQPDIVQRFVTFEKKGVKIAVIGLVEK